MALLYEWLMRATTANLERLAAAIGVLPVAAPASHGAWRAHLQQRIHTRQLEMDRRDTDAKMKAWTLAHSPRPVPEVPALRVITLRRYVEMGMNRDELKKAAPWAHAHELRMVGGGA